MKLVTFADGGSPRPGALLGESIVDLAAMAGRVAGLPAPEAVKGDMVALLDAGPAGMETAARLVAAAERDPAGALVPRARARLLAPLPTPRKIVCIGLNYRDHCEENNVPIPQSPVIFAKYATAVTGPGDPIVKPKLTEQLDYEAELAFVIGRAGRNIPESEAMGYVAGYTILHDVSARDIQFADGQWVRGKTFDTFAPMGPALVTPDEVPDPHNLGIRLDVNGEVLQNSNTRHLIFRIPFLISLLSRGFTWQPGDIVSTGTPAGVGAFRNPKVFLHPGDVVTITIDGVGTLSNPVVAEA
ncbi:MAG: fumarylacetoacetate hydrolase family protein [Armatimonadetes bacterium]|nr:fumarylacetoacetate hydrolase family protein [Armatimonadota bacterium]